ncbi:eukaryotic translation initiation factor 3 subunit l [Rhodnius prolixus]|uniref:Eukaryotic translation initiation factor 3 subunit L n=1 Tax=Rhodnius prolixus TaxID=13249 RepID=R4FLS1_RHOPR
MYSGGAYDDYEGGGYDRGYDVYGHVGYDYEPHSGDPAADLDYENRQYYKIPESVKNFLVYFNNVIREGLVFEIQNLYENNFPKLTEQYYEKRSWPEESEVAAIVGNDRVFSILYKELYFRHLHARIPNVITLEHRFQSFLNYCDLLNCMLSEEQPVDLVLPDQWLWELVDEFIYQFQSFSQYRAKLQNKTKEELAQLNANSRVWNVLCVLNVLHSLVDKSNIKKQLEVYASGGDPDSVAGEFGRHSLYKMLGYFSLVGLLRLHSLLGDYYQAIKVLENIEIHKKYSHVPACQISTSYYVGFAYMMMRRYADAIRTFSSILLYIQRTKQLFQSRTYQNDQINKQTDQMYHLLAICLVLHPQCIDESIHQHLREKNYHDKMGKMQQGDLSEFEACFQFACPKFLSPSPPPTTAPAEDYIKEATKHQTSVFMDEVKQQINLPTIRSYLKLYTTLPLSKLAMFMSKAGTKEELENSKALLRTDLLCFKHKMKNVVWTKGTSGLEGSFQSGSEIDFYMDHDMIHIADTKVANCYGDFFIRKILKFEDLNRKLHAIKI